MTFKSSATKRYKTETIQTPLKGKNQASNGFMVGKKYFMTEKMEYMNLAEDPLMKLTNTEIKRRKSNTC